MLLFRRGLPGQDALGNRKTLPTFRLISDRNHAPVFDIELLTYRELAREARPAAEPKDVTDEMLGTLERLDQPPLRSEFRTCNSLVLLMALTGIALNCPLWSQSAPA